MISEFIKANETFYLYTKSTKIKHNKWLIYKYIFFTR